MYTRTQRYIQTHVVVVCVWYVMFVFVGLVTDIMSQTRDYCDLKISKIPLQLKFFFPFCPVSYISYLHVGFEPVSTRNIIFCFVLYFYDHHPYHFLFCLFFLLFSSLGIVPPSLCIFHCLFYPLPYLQRSDIFHQALQVQGDHRKPLCKEFEYFKRIQFLCFSLL